MRSRPCARSPRGIQIALTADLSPEVGTACIDPSRIQQVIWNLLANAVRFTPEGGRVAIHVRRHDGTVEIEITDSGIRIRAEFLCSGGVINYDRILK